MKILQKIRSYIFPIAVILLATFAASCDNDTPNDGTEQTMSELTLTISARSASGSTARADGTPENPSGDNERINSWFIVFVDNNGEVTRMVSRTDEETGISPDAGVVDRETFKCMIPTGTYTLFAFANITPDELNSASGLSFAEGDAVTVADIEKAIWSKNLNLHSGIVPMSGMLRDVKVTNRIEEAFSVEVVRMLAKIRFKLTNNSGSDVTVNSISIDPVTTGSISLFPTGPSGVSYDYLGEYSYTPLPDAVYGAVSCEVNTPLADGESTAKSFYIQEAISDRQNENAFTIGLKVTHPDGISNFQQYNITHDIIGYINRNDIIQIPLELSRYDVTLRAIFYPPIGGYPAFLSTVDPDGSQIFTFGTQGEFAIVAVVTDKITGETLMPQRYNVEIISISDPQEIFSRRPSLDTSVSGALPYEITGALSTNEGRATVTLQVGIADPDDAAASILSISRTLYVIRDNNTQ